MNSDAKISDKTEFPLALIVFLFLAGCVIAANFIFHLKIDYIQYIPIAAVNIMFFYRKGELEIKTSILVFLLICMLSFDNIGMFYSAFLIGYSAVEFTAMKLRPRNILNTTVIEVALIPVGTLVATIAIALLLHNIRIHHV